jgi:hypothetical protein
MQLNEPYSSHVAEPRNSAPSRSTIGNVTWLPRQRDALTADSNRTIELERFRKFFTKAGIAQALGVARIARHLGIPDVEG